VIFFCFYQFVFEVTLNCTVSLCVSYCYRVASPVVTERLPTITFFWSVNIFIDRCYYFWQTTVEEMLGSTVPYHMVEWSASCGGNGVTGWICPPQANKHILDWVCATTSCCVVTIILALAISLLQLLKDTLFPPCVV